MTIQEGAPCSLVPLNINLDTMVSASGAQRAQLVRRGFLGGALVGHLSLVCYHAMIITRNEQCTHNYLLSVQVSLAGHPSNHKHCA